MSAAKYLVQRRTFDKIVQCGWGFGKRHSMTKWITRKRFDSLAEAIKYVDGLGASTFSERRILYRGKAVGGDR